MGNPITDKTKIGTLGELLVQLRLLQFSVQAAPPIKDSGNDLIAIRGYSTLFVQVKTSLTGRWSLSRLPNIYHVVALVKLEKNSECFELDKSKIYFIKKGEDVSRKRELNQSLVDELWQC